MATDLTQGLSLPADWRGRLLERVYQQFKATRWAPALANTLGKAANDLQGAALAVRFALSIDPVTDDSSSPAYGVGRGAQLDRIGRLVGQPRTGADDASYRLYLRARVAANRSDGTPDVLIGVMLAMFGTAAASYPKPVFERGGNAAFILRLRNPTTESEAEIARSFLGSAQQAGDRGILVTQVAADSEMFAFPAACYSTGSVSIGDAVIDVDDASDWPTSGSFIIDDGLADEETVAFTSRSGTTLYLGGGGPVNPHDTGAALVLASSVGRGFPACSYASGTSAPGDPSIAVVDDGPFSAGDSIVVDEGLSTEETLTVSSTSPGNLFVTPDLSFAHADGAPVVVVGSGGRLARAHEG